MEKNKIKTSTGEKIFTVFNYAFFTLLCLVMLYPFWHEIMLSFSSLEASMKGGIFLWPKGFNLDTYKSVFKTRTSTRASVPRSSSRLPVRHWARCSPL